MFTVKLQLQVVQATKITFEQTCIINVMEVETIFIAHTHTHTHTHMHCTTHKT